MIKRKIGKTGKEVFPIGLGAMPLSIQDRPDEKQALGVVHAALDCGITFIDTANVYCLDQRDIGHNERLITRALKQYPNAKSVIVATKGGLARPNGDWITDASPEKLRQACEKSLKDLETDCIFLYQLHAPDDEVPFEDSVGELAKLKKEGKIMHLGLSNVTSEQLESALEIDRIETVQNLCHVFCQRDFRNGLIDLCARKEITYIAYSPVGGDHGHVTLSQHPLLNELAHSYQTSVYCIALSWLLKKRDHILPIPGASRISSIRDSAKAPNVDLSVKDIARIDQLAGN